jgi:hypothetical protein
MAHECPECADDCDCLPGDILERNCEHCAGDGLDDPDFDVDDVDEDED